MKLYIIIKLYIIYRFVLVVVIITFLQLKYVTSQDASKTMTLSYSFFINMSSLLVILVHPLSVNTTVNSGQVNFTCEAKAEVINFRVNNTAADDANIANKGFHQQNTEPVNNTIRRRVLLVDPREGNNDTNVSCVGFSRSPSLFDDTSNTALLLIQGIYHVLYL